MSKDELIELPRATSATVKGPYIHYMHNDVVVDYDTEQMEGTLKWTRLIFRGVLAIEFMRDSCCRLEDIAGYKYLQCNVSSDWRDGHIERWERSVGFHDIQKELGGSARFRHYRVSFDDNSAINVLAEQVEIDAEPELEQEPTS